MKFLFTAIFMFSSFSYADCKVRQDYNEDLERTTITTDVPSHLKGATITVTLQDGRTTTVPAEKFKVVPRTQQFIVTKVSQSYIKICTQDKNRVSAVAGYGPTGDIKTTIQPGRAVLETKTGLVYGAQYQRMLGDRFSVGAQAQDNGTASVLLGFEF